MRPNTPPTRRMSRTDALPGYVFHADFETKTAWRLFDATNLLEQPVDYSSSHMPDEVTREYARKMHYAAHRMRRARTAAERERFQASYFALRDHIVLGNRKLVFRAVSKRNAFPQRAEDLTSDCQIVLIHAVCAYNPWLGIRFSTYAYTCLVRALSRLSQNWAADWFSRSVSIDALSEIGLMGRDQPLPEPSLANQIPIEEYLRDDHPLLSLREKQILAHRFSESEDPATQTLENVGKVLGLSKERVRQVQESALTKLRQALEIPSTPR